jgi:hypothetical protein
MSVGLLVLLTAASATGAAAQSAAVSPSAAASRAASEQAEEIVVRGRRLADFRIEVEQARVRAYDIFNEINSDDDFDVRCAHEQATGTRMRQQICRARFEDRISATAAKDYFSALRWRCGEVTADCIFDPDKSAAGISAAQAVEGQAPIRRDQMNEEIYRLARENLEFAQAILDWYDATLRYDELRTGRRDRARER